MTAAPVPYVPTEQDQAFAGAAMPRAVTGKLENDEGWFATVPGLRGVWGAGDTQDEALEDLRASIPGWRAVGRIISEQISADPAEAERLRQARQSARRTPPESWREDWDSAEDGVWDG